MDNTPIREIDTIFGGPYVGGDYRNAKRNYAKKAKDLPMANYIVNNNPHKIENVLSITFI